jgi:hypothetical protein
MVQSRPWVVVRVYIRVRTRYMVGQWSPHAHVHAHGAAGSMWDGRGAEMHPLALL